MALYLDERARWQTYRTSHDAGRDLWLLLADREKPPIDRIRAAILNVPTDLLAEIEWRAGILWSRVFRGTEYPTEGFVAWSQSATDQDVLKAVRTFVTDGGAWVPGRSRASGRPSCARFEPRILGTIRGAATRRRGVPGAVGPKHQQAKTARGGRPPADAVDRLVMHLAIDWERVVGHTPGQRGRSDRTPFGELVHHVFGWLEIETTEQALRRYWAIVSDARITPLDGGVFEIR